MNETVDSGGLTGAAKQSVVWMRAAGEPTRIRLLILLEQVDLTVTDLIEILGQSQPRLSRHLKLLVEAGLVVRFQEGAWAYFRTVNSGAARSFLDAVVTPLSQSDDTSLRQDASRLDAVLERRNAKAEAYFAANAQHWGRIRSLHIEEDAVEQEMLALSLDGNLASILDLGTGTGRMLQLFAPHVECGLGIDMSLDMLAVARAALSAPEFEHIQIRHSNVYELGEGSSFDLVVMHQVLHFLEDPGLALQQAAGRMGENGRLLIADFLPHAIEELREKQAHRRLGIDPDQFERWLASAGLKLETQRLLAPAADDEMSLTVALWVAVAS